MKETADIMSPVLADLFNKCISEGTFPRPFKISKVIPVYKRGDRSCPSSYRPIALTPIFGKVFELIIKKDYAITLRVWFILSSPIWLSKITLYM